MNIIQNLVVLVSISVILLNCYGMGSSAASCVVFFRKENDSLQTVLKIEEAQREDGRLEIQAYLIREDGSKPQPEYGTVLHSVPADKKITFSYSFEPHLAGRDLKRSWINVIMKSSLGNVYAWDEGIE